MLPKAPQVFLGSSGIEEYCAELRDVADSLRNKFDREFFRKEVGARAKLYSTLADRRPPESEAAHHFAKLAYVHREALVAFGVEPIPRKRAVKFSGTPLSYPSLPDELPLRVHFLSSGSLRRDRSAALAKYADYVESQFAQNGDSLLSVAVGAERTHFFERLIESTGADRLGPSLNKAGGFSGYINSHSIFVPGSGWDDPNSPWTKIRRDNFQAGLYHWTRRRGQLDESISLPVIPAVPECLPWDPDPKFRHILNLTQNDQLAEAMRLVDEIPGSEREVLFDEVLYLRFLLEQPPRGDDLRYLAKKHIKTSSVQARLEDEFEAYVACLDVALMASGPVPDDFPGLSPRDANYLNDLNDPSRIGRDTPPLKDWAATRSHYYTAFEAYGHPSHPRGRIFIWHPDLGSNAIDSLMNAFRPQLVEAENRFRRSRNIAEIGRGWASETALVDLFRTLFPDAVHQWTPAFLGAQSIDIYVPSLNLAVEYQGEQHYRPVEIFGGEEGLLATQARDKRKRSLLQANSIKLLEWRFDRPIKRTEIATAIRNLGLSNDP